MKLLEELALDAAYGLVTLRARAARERANAELRQSEARYHLLFDAAPVGIGTAGMDGNLLAVNRSMEDITGYTGDELLRLRIWDLFCGPGGSGPVAARH